MTSGHGRQLFWSHKCSFSDVYMSLDSPPAVTFFPGQTVTFCPLLFFSYFLPDVQNQTLAIVSRPCYTVWYQSHTSCTCYMLTKNDQSDTSTLECQNEDNLHSMLSRLQCVYVFMEQQGTGEQPLII